VTTTFTLNGKNRVAHTGGYIDKHGVGHFASGGGYGQFHGPGSGTSDSIPAMVSNGEYINSAAIVSRLGVGFFQRINQGAPVYQAASAARHSYPAQAAVCAPSGNGGTHQDITIYQQPGESSAELTQKLGFITRWTN
jgi:hypothetical protein